MVEEIETNNMQFLYTLSSQHNAKAWLQNCSKSVEEGGGGGQGMLIPIAVDWGATVEQVHNIQYSDIRAVFCRMGKILHLGGY